MTEAAIQEKFVKVADLVGQLTAQVVALNERLTAVEEELSQIRNAQL